MKLVIDANIIFAALIKEGVTSELLLRNELQLFAPELLFEKVPHTYLYVAFQII